MNADRIARIRAMLECAFEPTELLIKDQSHLHAGHAGAADGRGHFDVRIVSAAFEGLNRLERHRSVYGALDDLLQSDIHALRITAWTPEEHGNLREQD
jgi:BolA protein